MSMDKPWKIALVLLGIFVAGALTGGAVAVRLARKPVAQRPVLEQWGPMQMRRMAVLLDLTPAQFARLRPIVERNMEELMRLRFDTFAETRSIIERMDQEIAGELTPGQQAKFARENQERRERLQRIPTDRGGRAVPSGDRRDNLRPFTPGDGRFRPMRERMPFFKPLEKPPEKPAPKRPSDS